MVYKVAQFFSTSREGDIAKDFANESKDSVKVIFNIEGNSSCPLPATGGLSTNRPAKERVYSPLATFKVTAINKNKDNGIYRISPEEVTKNINAQALPY